MQKWLTFQYSFVCIQINSYQPRSWDQKSKEYFTLSEASEA